MSWLGWPVQSILDALPTYDQLTEQTGRVDDAVSASGSDVGCIQEVDNGLSPEMNIQTVTYTPSGQFPGLDYLSPNSVQNTRGNRSQYSYNDSSISNVNSSAHHLLNSESLSSQHHNQTQPNFNQIGTSRNIHSQMPHNPSLQSSLSQQSSFNSTISPLHLSSSSFISEPSSSNVDLLASNVSDSLQNAFQQAQDRQARQKAIRAASRHKEGNNNSQFQDDNMKKVQEYRQEEYRQQNKGKQLSNDIELKPSRVNKGKRHPDNTDKHRHNINTNHHDDNHDTDTTLPSTLTSSFLPHYYNSAQNGNNIVTFHQNERNAQLKEQDVILDDMSHILDRLIINQKTTNNKLDIHTQLSHDMVNNTNILSDMYNIGQNKIEYVLNKTSCAKYNIIIIQLIVIFILFLFIIL